MKKSNNQEKKYFKNHGVGKKWPFSIYHQPIEDKIYELASLKCRKSSINLNIGCAFFDSYPSLSKFGDWYACDIDSKCIGIVKKRYPKVKAKIIKFMPEYPPQTFDYIFATEVIEHIPNSKTWLQKVIQISKPGAIIVLTTPNYGLSILPIIEYTFLQIIALTKGFSRFGLHPNKYNKSKLLIELADVAPEGSKVCITTCSLGMVLVGIIKIPQN